MADDGFHEIQLSRKQLIALFMGAAVVLVVAFLCGVLVGRGVGNGVVIEGASAAAAPPPAAEAMPEEPSSGPASPATSATPPPPVDEDLGYQARLESKSPPADTVKPAPAANPKVETPPPAREPAAAAAAPAVIDTSDAGWLVQVAALRERSRADGVARRLAGKGYKAFVMAPGPKGSRMYRVVVGRFKSRQEAEQVKTRLEKEEQFKPWIIS